MERFLTTRAKSGHWWDIPLLGFSGIATAAWFKVAIDELTPPVDDLLITVLACAFVFGLVTAPICLYIRRRARQSQAEKIAKCLANSGQSTLTIGALERRTRISGAGEKLQKLIAKGYLRDILVDSKHQMLRFDAIEDAPKPVMDTGSAEFNKILHQIRDLNDRIEHRGVSDKIDRIEQLTGEMFRLIIDRPDRAEDSRKFIRYYLPITMKLLESYSLLEKQSWQGENITASRQKIEAVLDTIIKAIERQGDRLFKSDAMDVETDIQVLQTMLTADGLTGPERGLRL